MTTYDLDALLNALLAGNQLKRTPRTGWLLRGVPEAENVAAHSYGVAYITFFLAPLVDPPVDLGRALALAVLHDLPESVTTDIPRPAWRFLPPGSKARAENAALSEIVAGLPHAADVTALWAELQADETPAARLVHDADKLDLLLQAWQYESQSGNTQLAEFWSPPASFHFPVTAALGAELRRRAGYAA